MIQSRRSFLRGVGAFLAAPAIVRVSSLMPISVADVWEDGTWFPTYNGLMNFNELAAITRKAFIPRLYVELYGSCPTLNLLVENAA